MTARARGRPWCAASVAAVLLITACSGATDPAPSTPGPTATAGPLPETPEAAAQRYLAAWSVGDHGALYAFLAPSVRARYPEAGFIELHEALRQLPATTSLDGAVGTASLVVLPPEPRPPDLPAPTPLPTPTAPSGTPNPSPSLPAGTPVPAGPPPVLDGPVPGMEVPIELTMQTGLFGELVLERTLLLTLGGTGWQVRWSPTVVFPELGEGGLLALAREVPQRGRILAADGTVLAENREDGVRIYPQEALAGQTVGYVTEVTAEDLERLAAEGYQAGDVVGRSGLEAGAEALLRGRPGHTLTAVPEVGEQVELFRAEAVPGADIHTTIQPALQRTAEATLARYSLAGTAAIDPLSGDVWALASAPPLNPNAFSLGTTLSGIPLPPPAFSQILNNAVAGTYPAGSTFKPFTLTAALSIGVATAESGVTCPPTWEFSGFTFQNYEEHELPGTVSLADAMAFSCNTTYMPLSLDVYNVDPTALPRLVRDFGFGEPSGIAHLAEEAGIVPDAEYFAATEAREYGPFDQLQLAIGQGSFLGTPLQMSLAFAAIGNGGALWTPRLVTQAVLPDGTVVASYENVERRRVSVDPAQLAYVVDTLQAVVDLPFGTGAVAFGGFGIPVAGKSGTAETSTPNPDSWFAGFAPADAPTIAIATVLIEEPLSTGGADAAPLVREVMQTHFAP